MAINQLTKMFLPRQNVVEQPRAHLVGNSSETAHPHGVRPPRVKRKEVTKKFQSTHPHGVRLILIVNLFLPLLFQSTHPHGVRLIVPVLHLIRYIVSIHAPTRGATYHYVRYSSFSDVSIHAPTRGATFAEFLFFFIAESFNPRTHTGCDSFYIDRIYELAEFQSTHPHGVRPPSGGLVCVTEFVSIHAPTRGTTQRLNGNIVNGKFQSTHPHGVRP